MSDAPSMHRSASSDSAPSGEGPQSHGAGAPPALSAQQRKFSTGTLGTYRELVVGSGGWGALLGYELYTTLLSGLPGLIGYASRGAALPLLLKGASGMPNIGRGVTIRQPHRITLGRGVMIDDYAVLDVRGANETDVKDAGISLGDHVLVGRNSLLVAKHGQIILHRGVNISSCCRIATQSRVEIGESTLIAAYAYIGPGNHRTDDTERSMIEAEMDVRGGVVIGAHSWIGAHATILDGVTIGEGAIVGAHSLVRTNVPPRTIVAGTPARVIGER